MPIHGRIISQVISKGSKFVIAETKFWRGLYGPSGRYPGVSNYKQAAQGIKHGLAGGSAIGSLIGSEGKGPTGGTIQINTPYKQDKTRKRYSASSSSKFKFKRSNRKGRRCTCARKYRRSSYRKRY